MPQAEPLDTAIASAAYGELPDRIYDTLKEEIIRGRVAAGSRLVEADLALRFGVSRTPIREVLARLVRESYVVTDGSGRRTRFLAAPLTTEAIAELWGIMGSLEGLGIQAVATWSAERRKELAKDLEALNRELGVAAAARPREVDRVGELMSEFHVCFMRQCAGPWLQHLYERVRSHVRRYEWAYGSHSMASHSPSVAEHRGIIAAIAEGDAQKAREKLERHWSKGLKRTIAIVGQRSARQSSRTPGRTGSLPVRS